MTSSTPDDDGRLAQALRALGLSSPTGMTKLERARSAALWDAFIDPRARHYMLLPRDAWPQADAPLIKRPIPSALDAGGVWLVFWMRENACVVPAGELEAHLDQILMTDDEGVVAINTTTLDAILAVGGRGELRVARRPAGHT